MVTSIKKDGSWYYVIEPDDGAHAPERQRIKAGDGCVLTKRTHGYGARVECVDRSGLELPVATLLRGASVAGRYLEREEDSLAHAFRVILGPAGTEMALDLGSDGIQELHLDGSDVASLSSHHILEARVHSFLESSDVERTPLPDLGNLPEKPTPRVLFFEALMNTDTPHNDTELSQGVLHMMSPLQEMDMEVVLVDVKMSIVGEDRPVIGLERLEAALEGGAIGLVCITLLEGYFEGVCSLISKLRELGCRAHIAVGGVMPTLTPAHVAAHLPEVSFVCRGAGEPVVCRLAEILGDGSVDTPLSADQRTALLAMDGLFVIDRASEETRLLGCNPIWTTQVEDLDKVPLDLTRIEPRHLINGVEICTSRGCLHKCTFCSIIGRQSYQARSAEGIFELLQRYHAHYTEIFGDEIPTNAFRVHFSDDDFACDRDRARHFFEGILNTPFRLTSVQVAITDLCAKQGSKLVTDVDKELLDSIKPECFAHSSEDIPERDFILDHGDRRWSSYLQMGVESFSDKELVRLGKGYKRKHVRAIAEELAGRGIHFDSYFILSNGDTSGDDLIDVLEEVCRLKLRYPTTFHIKFPIVKRLVSVFPSASYRRLLRQGSASSVAVLRLHAQVENHPEYDYPFVEYDEPRDPWVSAASASDFFTDKDRYLGSLERLRDLWIERLENVPPGSERREGERLIRRLEDLSRHLVFELLNHARNRANPPEDWFGEPMEEALALKTGREILGPPSEWKEAFQHFSMENIPRMVVIPTWQCELRCGYCFIPKQDGRVSDVPTVERSIDLLLSSQQTDLVLQFFGGEALLEYELIQHALRYGSARAERLGKNLSFIVSTNGWSLDEEKLNWFRDYAVKLELSLDGDQETQNQYRSSGRWIGGDSYENSIVHRADAINSSGLPYDVIMVVHPKVVDRMPANFFHVADLGFRRIQVNFALGFKWTEEQKQSFADGLMKIGSGLRERWARGEHVEFVNLDGRPMKMRLNGELTIDYDGTVYGGNGFLHETEHKDKFLMGTLDDLRGFDSYCLELSNNEYLLEWSYPPEVTENNLQVGAIFSSFIRWMQKEEVNPIRRAVQPEFRVG